MVVVLVVVMVVEEEEEEEEEKGDILTWKCMWRSSSSWAVLK